MGLSLMNNIRLQLDFFNDCQITISFSCPDNIIYNFQYDFENKINNAFHFNRMRLLS